MKTVPCHCVHYVRMWWVFTNPVTFYDFSTTFLQASLPSACDMRQEGKL